MYKGDSVTSWIVDWHSTVIAMEGKTWQILGKTEASDLLIQVLYCIAESD